jgi:hypothetical protein
MKEPTNAGAIPAPGTFGGSGKWVRNARLMTDPPCINTSTRMKMRGIIARTNANTIRIVINLFIKRRQREMLVEGLDLVIVVTPFTP